MAYIGRAGVLAALLAVGPTGGVAAQHVELEFAPVESRFAEAERAYETIWSSEGARILSSLEELSEITFDVASIEARVIDGPSWAGGSTMGMRYSYPPDTKKATLTHELGHILIGDLIPEDDHGQPVFDHHAFLFLFLYDVWTDLWGEDFAQAQVAVESQRRGLVDYEGLWEEALDMTRFERTQKRRGLMRDWRGVDEG